MIFFFITSFSASPATYYVDKNNPAANDNNPGTEQLPFKTISKGVEVASGGDTVFVKQGVYNEDLVMQRSGFQGDPIVFKSFGSDVVVIDGTGLSTKLIDWHGEPDGGFQKNFIEFDGFEIINAEKWAFWIQGDHNVVKNCKIHETGHTAIQIITGSYNLISNNEIFNTGWNAVSWEANNGGTGIRTDFNVVEKNYIHDIDSHVAINGFPNESAGNWDFYGGVGNIVRYNFIDNCLEGLYFRYEKELEIYGNVIANITGTQGLHLHVNSGDENSTYVSNTRIYNNVFVNCIQNGIYNTNAKDVVIKNNIFYGNVVANSKYDIYFSSRTESPGNFLNSNIYFGDVSSQEQVSLYSESLTIPELQAMGMELNGAYADPLFVNINASDFKLLENSPALDAGENLGSPYNFDIEGVSRPQGAEWDIGPYEMIFSPDLEAPKLLNAQISDSVTVILEFSEPLEISAAEETNNYQISGGIEVLNAVLDISDVILTTTAHLGGDYIITVSDLTDLSGNTIDPAFNTAQYTYIPPPAGEPSYLNIISAEASVIPEPEHGPEKAIDGLGVFDGDPDSRWAGDNMPQWIQFELQEVSPVSRTKISFFNWDNGRIYNFSIQVSTDTLNWLSVVSNASSANEEWTVNDFNPVEAKFIRVIFNYSNQNHWAGMWEAEIYGITGGLTAVHQSSPEKYALSQNFPNPFNPSTTIKFVLEKSGYTRLDVYNIIGELVSNLVDEELNSGEQSVRFNAAGLASGVYFYTLQTEAFTETRKMLLLE